MDMALVWIGLAGLAVELGSWKKKKPSGRTVVVCLYSLGIFAAWRVANRLPLLSPATLIDYAFDPVRSVVESWLRSKEGEA